jgi:hypothetical protein
MNVTRLPATQYQDFIASLSERAPMWGLKPTHITLTTRDLGLVMREYGEADFVNEALSDKFGEKDDTLSQIARAASLATLYTAEHAIGAIVQDALINYAAKIVRTAILDLRERTHSYDQWDAAHDAADLAISARGA